MTLLRYINGYTKCWIRFFPKGNLFKTPEMVRGQRGPNHVGTEIRDLKAKEDRYDGMIVDTSSLPDEMLTFVGSLRLSLKLWKIQNKKGVWPKLPLDRSNLVHPALQEGFRYHHAETTYVMLVIWLSDLPSTIPANASHQIGIGAFVLNDKNEYKRSGELSEGLVSGKCLQVLSIRYDILRKGRGHFCWSRSRGGGRDRGMCHLGSTTFNNDFPHLVYRIHARKIATTFVKVIGFRVSEYRAQEYLQQRKMLKAMLDVCIATAESTYESFSLQDMQAGSNRKLQYFYYNKVDCQD